MKKQASAICLAALLLTGCGSSAGTAGSSTPAADSSSAVEPAAEPDTEQAAEPQEAETTADQEYYDYYGIDVPIPAGMTKNDKAARGGLCCWNGGTESDPVYLAFDVMNDDEYQDESKGHTLDELPEGFLWLFDMYLHELVGSHTEEQLENIQVDSRTEEEFMGYKTLCEKGVLTTYEGLKVNFTACYAYVDFPRFDSKHIPTFWFACTPSDDKDAIELMNKAATDPLTMSKLN